MNRRAFFDVTIGAFAAAFLPKPKPGMLTAYVSGIPALEVGMLTFVSPAHFAGVTTPLEVRRRYHLTLEAE